MAQIDRVGKFRSNFLNLDKKLPISYCVWNREDIDSLLSRQTLRAMSQIGSKGNEDLLHAAW